MPPIHRFYPARNSSVLPCTHSSAPCLEHHVEPNSPKQTEVTAAASKRSSVFKLPDFNAPSPQCHLLTLLPVELLHNIAYHLSPSDRIAVALTCKAFYSTLGTTEFSDLKTSNEEEAITFLTTLHRDLPNHRLCRYCKMLHSPSTIALPQNKLRRGRLPHTCLAYLQAPGEGRDGSILYWLSDEHMRLAVSKQICSSTLHCSGSIKLGETLPDVPALHSTFFKFKIKPVCTRGNLIVESTYEIFFSTTPRYVPSVWSEAYVRTLLAYFDIRCCLHCSTSQNMDEMICVLYHEGGGNADCTRAENAGFDDGCGHHVHSCECVTDYRIETDGGIRVTVWQWLGNRKNDAVLHQRGMLKHLYEDALLDDGKDVDIWP